ncbi:LysM peptidoglycan-binding domain-containing protein [Paenibacillus alvei]|uniref:LysM peptidoglycan-binding domain-containing protein n=1 Tax=Paenibacillus alvei TaxID=44250 RepID=UPI0022833920|nr:LysM peptidoglycan-binding domain-containing protein [Paenibacillus alvei]MCY9707898.1 LysM peptidoglycan-binding domain-containing protein [Paenibacillus alvei]
MKIHIVKKGDTLYALAKKYGITLEKLISMNSQIANPNELDVGMKIKVPSTPVPSSGHEIVHKHVVKEGDTLWKLSKAWGIPLQTMIDANPQLKNPNVLVIGQVVNIPKVQADGNVPAPNENVPPPSKEELTKPKSENTKPKSENTKPKEEITKPKSEVTKPKEEVNKPNVEVKPKEEVNKPNAEVNPKEEVNKPNAEIKPKEEVTKPNAEIKPKEEVKKPKVEIVQPKVETKKPKSTTEFMYEMEKVNIVSPQNVPWVGNEQLHYNQPMNYPSSFNQPMGNQSFQNQPNIQHPFAAPAPSCPPNYEIPVPVLPQYVSPIPYESCGCNQINSNWYSSYIEPNVTPNIHPHIHPNIHPNVEPNIHPHIQPNVHPNIEPNIHPYIHPNIHPNVEPNIHPHIQPNVHPNIEPNIHPHIHPNVHPNIEPNIHPHIHPNVHPNIEPNIHPHIHPNVHPNVEPNIHPHIQPNVHPNIQPNMKPKVEPNSQLAPYDYHCMPTPIFCDPGFPPIPTAIYPPYPPVYGGAASTVPGYIQSAIPAAIPTGVWGPVGCQPFVYPCGYESEHGKHSYENQSWQNASNMHAPIMKENDSYMRPSGYSSDGVNYNPSLYGAIPGLANSSIESNASNAADIDGLGERAEGGVEEVDSNVDTENTEDKEGHISNVGSKGKQAKIKGTPSRTTKKKKSSKKTTAQERSSIKTRSIPWING